MRHLLKLSAIIVALLMCTGVSVAADLTRAFMNCTYLIQSHTVYGTAFVIGEPVPDAPSRSNLVLVMAAHILESMPGEKAVLHARVHDGDRWRKVPWPITIRHQGRALWTRHPAVDIAALRVALPQGSSERVPAIDLAATDADYHRFGIQPGEAVMVLGFPLAMGSGDAGFAVLRGGRVASYPLTPIRAEKTFLVDFPVFPGNSGGPVIMESAGRELSDGTRAGRVQILLGVVSREALSVDTGPDATATIGRPLSLAWVVHADFIRDLIEMLPPP
ncbi:MAG: serine protease [Pseudomonadota bacterium]